MYMCACVWRAICLGCCVLDEPGAWLSTLCWFLSVHMSRASVLPVAKHQASRPCRSGRGTMVRCADLFKVLPLGARIGRETLVVHGGVWRKPVPPKRKGKKRPLKRSRSTLRPDNVCTPMETAMHHVPR
jgi:hypothetical protein